MMPKTVNNTFFSEFLTSKFDVALKEEERKRDEELGGVISHVVQNEVQGLFVPLAEIGSAEDQIRDGEEDASDEKQG